MKYLKSSIFAVIAFLFFSVPVNGQILYKVEKPGNDKTSYILGTHHFASLDVVDSIAELPGILKCIDKLYGELDMSQMSDPVAMMAMQSTLMAPSDSTLDKVMTQGQLARLDEVWNSLTGGVPPVQMMYGMKPSVLSTQIAAFMSQKVFPDLNPLEGIDITMQNRARALGKPVEGLETMAFQMELLYNQPISKQTEGLVKILDELDKNEEQAITLSNAYINHDLDTILKVMEEEEDSEEALDRLIFSRNASWVQQLSKEMPDESILVVVGAGHIPGPKGIVEGLRKAGFNVTPIE